VCSSDLLKKEIGELIDRIEAATEYEPHESPLCDWCPYWDLCPVKKMPKSGIR
jgi:CRISPR/Cas system-associated exonuclease Cas4 (RecB family)